MLHGRKRKAFKDLARQARARSQGPAQPADLVHEAACPCGNILFAPESQENQRAACPECRREFMVNFMGDASGKRSLAPVFLGSAGSVDSTLVEAQGRGSRKKTQAPSDPGEDDPRKGLLDDAIMPRPPDSISFACPCGKKMVAVREQYDSRVKCPHCKSRLVTTLVFNAATQSYAIEALRLSDPPAAQAPGLDRG